MLPAEGSEGQGPFYVYPVKLNMDNFLNKLVDNGNFASCIVESSNVLLILVILRKFDIIEY